MEEFDSIINIGEKLKIEPKEDKKRAFIAIVEAVTLEGIVLVPYKERLDLSFIKENSSIRAVFLRENSICSFDSRVKFRIDKPNTSLIIEPPGELIIEKVECCQRLGFTEVEGFFDFRYEVIEKGKFHSFDFKEKAVGVKIGGDGLTMVSIDQVSVNTLMAIELNLFKQRQPIRLFAKVSQVTQQEDLYRIEVAFENLSEKNRDAILKYVFQRQLELRNKGVL